MGRRNTAAPATTPGLVPEQEEPMPNPFVKLWKYLTASANAQIDQRADPKIQIAQAIEAEQQRQRRRQQIGRDGRDDAEAQPA